MYGIRLLCLFVAVVIVRDTHAAATAESRQAARALITPLAGQCAKELGVPLQVVKEADENNKRETLDGCLLACIYRKAGLINDEGNFDVQATKEVVNRTIKGEDQVTANKINDECASVNDKSVGDGAKGCERAKLLSECFAQYKDSFHLF